MNCFLGLGVSRESLTMPTTQSNILAYKDLEVAEMANATWSLFWPFLTKSLPTCTKEMGEMAVVYNNAEGMEVVDHWPVTNIIGMIRIYGWMRGKNMKYSFDYLQFGFHESVHKVVAIDTNECGSFGHFLHTIRLSLLLATLNAKLCRVYHEYSRVTSAAFNFIQ